jgi:predicted metalloprotease with PDZ domain
MYYSKRTVNKKFFKGLALPPLLITLHFMHSVFAYLFMTPYITYTIAAPHPQNHLFEVTLTITHPLPEGQLLQLPAWIPGSYLIRDFARHIVDIRAECEGQVTYLQKKDKSTWQVGKVAGVLTVYYRVYAYDLSVRGAYLDTTRGFFNGSSVCLAVVGQEAQRCEIILNKPIGKAYQHWKVATTLPRLQDKQDGFGTYYAGNYDELIDHPVELGVFNSATFRACDVLHEVVIAGRHTVDYPRLLQDIEKICTYQIRFFGEPAPFKSYVFLIMVTGSEYGGLEHRNSAALMCRRDDLPQPRQKCVTEGYHQLLGLISHEYFHAWNVKRMKPQAFAPYTLNQENYTRLLWAFEGITSYYDELTLVRTGLISVQAYLNSLSKMISSVLYPPGSAVQSLEEASFDAWIKYYRQNENSPNSLVSYYSKGAVVALLLDATIRQETAGVLSLDTVMQALWQRYGKDFATTGQGIAESAWEKLAQEITGVDLQAFFTQTLRQTKALPLQQTLAYLGIEYQERMAAHAEDKGGEWQKQTQPAPIGLGIKYKADAIGVCITHVLTDSPAEAAGLAPGDVLLAMEGIQITPAKLEKALALYESEQTITFHLFRRDELMKVAVKLFHYCRPVCALRMKKNWQATPAASWLGKDKS